MGTSYMYVYWAECSCIIKYVKQYCLPVNITSTVTSIFPGLPGQSEHLRQFHQSESSYELEVEECLEK